MARGKAAAQNANRRYEAAIEHIDRLTTELADAKMRARQHEAAARRLPVVDGELARLRALLTANTSDDLERQRANHEVARAQQEKTMEQARVLFFNVVERAAVANAEVFSHEDLGTLKELGWLNCVDLGEAARVLRRSRERGHTEDPGDRQDNRRTVEANLEHAGFQKVTTGRKSPSR